MYFVKPKHIPCWHSITVDQELIDTQMYNALVVRIVLLNLDISTTTSTDDRRPGAQYSVHCG
jgi:hypothetical protein